MSLLCRLKNLVHKGLLKKEDLDRIIIIPKGQENKAIKMRDATPEERASIAKYINNISKPTVVSFENLEQESCDDYISRNKVLEGKVIHQSCDGVEIIDSYAVPVEYIEQLPSVRPKSKTGPWIPISERIPEKSGNYWCTFGGTNHTGKDYYTTELDAKELFDDTAEEYVGW